MSEWVIIVYRQFSNCSAISWREQLNYQWNDDEVRFVLDEHTELDFYSTSSLKQQSAGRNVAPLWHIIMIQSQPVFALTPYAACLVEKQQIPILSSLVWPDRGSNHDLPHSRRARRGPWNRTCNLAVSQVFGHTIQIFNNKPKRKNTWNMI